MTAAIVSLGAVLGACLGSFANVLIHRLPRDQQVVAGRSCCPHCRVQIAWYDNLPVASWLILRGRCRACRGPIAWRYPAVELAGAALAAGCLWWYGPTAAAGHAYVLLLLLLVIAVIDWEHMVIPHTLTVSGLVAGLALAPFTGPGLAASLLGIVVGGGVVLALSEGYRLLRGQPGMGGGDVMLMAMVGAFLGPWPAAAVLGAGALLGTLYVLVRGAGRVQGAAKLPFGTFLAAGGAVVLVWGTSVWTWYVGLMS
ncbi:MAG: prepilin peptidase [Candidatus Krumholzibacteriia bacterium]